MYKDDADDDDDDAGDDDKCTMQGSSYSSSYQCVKFTAYFNWNFHASRKTMHIKISSLITLGSDSCRLAHAVFLLTGIRFKSQPDTDDFGRSHQLLHSVSRIMPTNRSLHHI
jgi:hypothetical protein